MKYHSKILKNVKVTMKNVNRLVFFGHPLLGPLITLPSDISQGEPLILWSRLRMRNTRMYGLLFQSQNSKTISNMFHYNINALCAYTLRVQNTFCVFIVFKWNPKFQGRIYKQDGQRGVLPGQWTPLIAAPIRRSISSILHPPPLRNILTHIYPNLIML